MADSVAPVAQTVPGADPFAALDGAQFMLLTTFRKSGEGVPTVVWFARQGDTLYLTTAAAAGKLKRIRNTGRVTVAPSDRMGKALGPAVEARGRALPPEEFERARAALRSRYRLPYYLITFLGALRRTERVFIAITPA